MVQASSRNAGGPSPWGGVSQEEAQDVLQGFHLPSSMEYPVIPRAAGEVAGERNCLGLPTEKLIEMAVERINQSVVTVVTASPLSFRSALLCFHVSPEKW